MGRFLIVSKVDHLQEYLQIAKEYSVGFEINDFFDTKVLDDRELAQKIIGQYKESGIPEGSTMHGAFYDIVIFSNDEKIQEISMKRMKQSMEIAKELGVKGVVFHTNVNPTLSSEQYDDHAVAVTVTFMKELLTEYPDINIYLENMFDADPEILVRISEQLIEFSNYGVCLDYAHASISATPVGNWVEQLAPFIEHVHINDNDLKRDLHLALGTGHIDWNEFAMHYRRTFDQCSVLVEMNDPSLQKASLDYLERNFIGIAASWKKLY